jgi:hypothetical protein
MRLLTSAAFCYRSDPLGVDLGHGRADVSHPVHWSWLAELGVNTLSAKADSFFGERSHRCACTQSARSRLRFAVANHLTTKLSQNLGAPGRKLPASESSNPSDLLSKFYPPQDVQRNRILLKEPLDDNTSDTNHLPAIHPPAEAGGPLAS